MAGAALLALLLTLLLPSGALGFGPLSQFGASVGGPGGIAIGEDGRAFVADSAGDRIAVFSPSAVPQGSFGVGLLSEPGDVALEPLSGFLYVADTGNDEVDVFTEEGDLVMSFGVGLAAPRGLAVTGSEVYVADTGNNRVAAYDLIGIPGPSFGAETLLEPQDVAPGPGGTIAVSDAGNDRVALFTPEGVPGALLGEGFLVEPTALLARPGGGLYVADTGNNRVSEYDGAGAFVRTFGEGVLDGASAFQVCTEEIACLTGIASGQPGSVAHPVGIALDCRGALYVAELGPPFGRVERFGEPGTRRPPCSEPVTPLQRPAETVPEGVLPESKFQFGKLVLNRKRGTAILFVFVPGPGRLALSGNGVRSVRRKSGRRGGLVKMPVQPTGELKRKLRKKGRAKGRVRVTYRPTDGQARTKRKPILLLKRRG